MSRKYKCLECNTEFEEPKEYGSSAQCKCGNIRVIKTNIIDVQNNKGLHSFEILKGE